MLADDYRAYIGRIETALGLSGDTAREARAAYALSTAQARVKNLTNLAELPEGLDHVVIRIAAGEYLDMAFLGGLVNTDAVPALVKQITEGDTTVSFAAPDGASGTQLLGSLINGLKNGYMDEIYRYRRLLW